jgi:tetratricopeptide (TPR) repeat protein
MALLLAAMFLPAFLFARGGGGGHGGGGHGGGGHHGGEGHHEEHHDDHHDGHHDDHHDGHHDHHDHGWDHHHWWNHNWYGANYYPDYYYAPWGYGYYGGPNVTVQNYQDSDNEDTTNETATDHGSNLSASAWTALGNSQFEDSEEQFENVIDAHPSLGAAKIGLAIALAEQGNLPRAVIELRRAAHYDPKSLDAVPNNRAVNDAIDHVIERYQNTMAKSTNQADPNFAIAALQYIRGRKKMASDALNAAVQAGDTTAAATNLRNLINGQ